MLEKMSRYHPELIVSNFMSASVTAVIVRVTEPMVAVATAESTNTVALVISSTVAPVGIPEPKTDAPGLMPVVLLTVTFALPLEMADAGKDVAVPAVSMLRIAVTPAKGSVRPSRRLTKMSMGRTVPQHGGG